MPHAATSKPGVTIVGTGAVGHVLARRLAETGYPILGILSRRLTRAGMLADETGAHVVSADWTDLPPDTRLVFCCVSDDAVSDVAEYLAGVSHAWSDTTVAHTSGLLTTEALKPLAEVGAQTLSFHPLQTFTKQQESPFAGIYIALEGTPEAVQTGKGIAAELGARYLELPAQAKALYHLAASMASNFFVTLIALAQETLNAVGLEPNIGLALLQPLVEQTWRNVLYQSPERALTGPIVRGDQQTIELHAETLKQYLPHLVPVYGALGMETVRLAVRSGRLDAQTADDMLETLHTLVTSFDPSE